MANHKQHDQSENHHPDANARQECGDLAKGTHEPGPAPLGVGPQRSRPRGRRQGPRGEAVGLALPTAAAILAAPT